MPSTLNGRVPTQIHEDEKHSDNLTLQTPSPSTDDWSDVTQELVDTIPSVWTRGLLYFLLGFTCLVLPWAMLFKVDETGTARGKLKPKGKTVKLDTLVTASVSTIPVNEGSIVKPGEPVLILDSQLVHTELRQVKDKLEGQLNRLSQLDMLKKQLTVGLATQQQQNQAQQLEKQAQIEQVRQNLTALQNSYDLQKEEKFTQVNQAKQALSYSQTAIELVENGLTSAQQEVERYRRLSKEGIVAEVQVVQRQDVANEKKKLYAQNQSDIEQAKLRFLEQQRNYERTLRQAKAEIQQAYLRLKEQQRSYQTLTYSSKLALLKSEEQLKNLETQITTLKAEIAQTRSQIKTLQLQLEQRVLRSPIAGRVFQLPIQRAGAVVQPGTMVAEIAPLNAPLILRAQIATNESGSLQKGLPVKLKFDAYPFQEYGVIEGELVEISPTTTEVETPNGKVAAYNLGIALKKNCIPKANDCIPLRPGDTATAEVIVRQRRIIDFLLDPFKQLQQGELKL
ncbi:HlyD family efflux transporter periplasmic adaptor subunit [Scytonema sp. UIC 10036]|uniref:HlyD family efflux transporter periplasmic adaptor subunit n=1 Tax=Scytonema sp. UIC 10036 TaxID=2304196 RepID=UPI0012DA290D|nr:HlyD family efflux transporter periplasmic adaptor subunit [Scytonema sp. UIC 10036]MUH00272.1 HlyD family efflux transporter periplasmic adaptor subunit [Scytonema sp. UIC 10036]